MRNADSAYSLEYLSKPQLRESNRDPLAIEYETFRKSVRPSTWITNFECNYRVCYQAVNRSIADFYSQNETISDGKVICLCLIQSLFEGAMYVFVLEWTPALTHASNGESIPHGYIFASFMVAIMMGSSIFKMLSKYYRPESFMR